MNVLVSQQLSNYLARMAKKNAEHTMRPWSEYLEDLGNMVGSLFNESAASFNSSKAPTQSDSLLSPCTRIRLASGLIDTPKGEEFKLK